MDNDKTLEGFIEETSADISLNSTEFEYDSDSISNDIEIEDFDIAEEEDTTRSKSPSKLEKIADLIINAVIIRNQQRLIDQDTQEDNISYEKSEKRLIVCGLGLPGLCSVSSFFLSFQFSKHLKSRAKMCLQPYQLLKASYIFLFLMQHS